MSTMTMRIDDVDAAVVRKYAKFEGKTISILFVMRSSKK